MTSQGNFVWVIKCAGKYIRGLKGNNDMESYTGISSHSFKKLVTIYDDDDDDDDIYY